MSFPNVVVIAQQLLKPVVEQANCLVDATSGNGHDTLFLAKNSAPSARIWSFDIQQAAVEKTRQCLIEAGLDYKVQCFQENHAHLAAFLPKNEFIDVVLFNLGYLPNGDHAITTQAESTLAAITQILPRLAVQGVVAVVAYPGHPAGKIETEALHTFLTQLDQKNYHVSMLQMINQIHEPPILFLLEKRRSDTCEGFASCQNKGDY